MKKYTAAGLAVLLASSGVAPAALADGQDAVTEEEQQGQEQDESVHNEEEPIDTLTLEMALEFAMNENTSLLLIEDRLQQLKSQFGGTEDDYRELKEDIEDLEDEMDELREEQKKTGNRTFQTRLQIQNEIERLEDQLEPLEDSFRQMNSNKTSLEYDKAKAEQGVKLSTTSTFVQLASAQDQIDFLKDSLKTEQQRVRNVKTRYDIGLASRNEFHTAQRELTRIQSQIDRAETQLENNMAVFALNIGIVNHPDIQLQAPELEEIQAVTQETPTAELVENSFSMKQAKEALALAEADRDDIYEDEDATSFEKEQADLNVQMEERNITQLEDELTRAINEAFTQADNQYQAVMDAQFELDYAREDVKALKTQLDIGVIPQADYDLSKAQVDKALHDLETAKQDYYMAIQQVESIRSGLIQQ